MKEIFRTNWQLYFLLVVAGLIPTDTNIFPVVCLWFAAWIYTREYKKLKLSFWVIISISFFTLHLLGISYSSDKASAIEQTGNRLCFAALPLLISTCCIGKENKKHVFLVFVMACVCISVFLISRSVFFSLRDGSSLSTYSRFSFFLHPGYVSMFMVWAIVLLIKSNLTLNRSASINFLIRNGVIFILVACILFCASKIGIISLALAVFACSFHRLKNAGFSRNIAVSLIPVIFFSCIFINKVPAPLKRLQTGLTVLKEISSGKSPKIYKMHKDEESTLIRVAIWNLSLPIMHDHLVFGTGNGDVKDELMSMYKQKQLTAAFKSKLNAHNQFIETQLGLGIAGSLPLFILTFGLCGYGIYRREFLLSSFAALMCINLFVESMFEWRVACEFFPFFLFLLLAVERDPKEKEKNEGLKIEVTGF